MHDGYSVVAVNEPQTDQVPDRAHRQVDVCRNSRHQVTRSLAVNAILPIAVSSEITWTQTSMPGKRRFIERRPSSGRKENPWHARFIPGRQDRGIHDSDDLDGGIPGAGRAATFMSFGRPRSCFMQWSRRMNAIRRTRRRPSALKQVPPGSQPAPQARDSSHGTAGNAPARADRGHQDKRDGGR